MYIFNEKILFFSFFKGWQEKLVKIGNAQAKHNRQRNNQRKEKRTCRIVNFAVLPDHRVKLKESTKKDKYLDLARELKKKKIVEHETDDYTDCNWCPCYGH